MPESWDHFHITSSLLTILEVIYTQSVNKTDFV